MTADDAPDRDRVLDAIDRMLARSPDCPDSNRSKMPGNPPRVRESGSICDKGGHIRNRSGSGQRDDGPIDCSHVSLSKNYPDSDSRTLLGALEKAATALLPLGTEAEAVMRFHMEHGERTPPETCAGCGVAIGDISALDLADGCRVHFPRGHGAHDCLICYGERWRRAAAEALILAEGKAC
jgi:hypothetical protein